MKRIAEQPLVSVQFISPRCLDGGKLDWHRGHSWAWTFDRGAETDREIRPESKAQIIITGRERPERGPFELDQNLGRADWQRLAGTNQKRDVGPSPRIHLKSYGRKRLDPRTSSYARLIQVTAKLSAH